MIRPYWGEFLVNPAPLHLTLEKCSYKCRYCFVDNVKVDHKATFSYLTKTRSDMTGEMVAKGFPVVASNTSDPFCQGNDDTARKFIDRYRGKVFLQTKGGKRALETISEFRDKIAALYVTVDSDDNGVLKKYGVNTPPVEHRMELLSIGVSLKIPTICGVNPLIPRWWTDFEAFAELLAKIGVRHVWHGELHMRENPNGCPKELLAYGRKKVKPDKSVINYCLEVLDGNGINCFSGGTSNRLGFWDEYYSTNQWFPTVDDFFSKLKKVQDRTGRPVAFAIDDFMAYARFCDHFAFKTSCKDYLSSYGQTLREKRKAGQRVYSWRELVEILFDPVEYPTPFRQDCVFVLFDGGAPVLENGRDLILVFDHYDKSGGIVKQAAGCVEYGKERR